MIDPRPADDDLVPVSVRLGEVVPPEDPEDWTKPLTWLAAAGMLLAPTLALAWFGLAPPAGADAPTFGTWLLAAALAAGGALTGASQIGALRTFTATIGAALLAALLTVIAGAVLAGQRQVGEATPTLAHALAAALAGLAGAAPAAGIGPLLVPRPAAASDAAAGPGARWRRAILPAGVGVAVSALVVPLLFRA